MKPEHAGKLRKGARVWNNKQTCKGTEETASLHDFQTPSFPLRWKIDTWRLPWTRGQGISVSFQVVCHHQKMDDDGGHVLIDGAWIHTCLFEKNI